VILIDDLGDPSAEAALLTSVVQDHAAQLAGGAFLRVDASGRVRLGES
jgi:hypothetical protein